MHPNQRQLLLFHEFAGNNCRINRIDYKLFIVYFCIQLTWSKAYDYCQTNRMTLLSIESSSEQLAIVKYVMPIILASEYQFFI